MAFSTKNAASLNVTPMIDVLLVLLIIYMVAAAKYSEGLDSKVPQAPQDTSAPAAPNLQDIVVIVRGDETVELNTQPVRVADLEARFKDIFRTRGNHVLFIGASDADLDFGHVGKVIDMARGAGLTQVALLPKR